MQKQAMITETVPMNPLPAQDISSIAKQYVEQHFGEDFEAIPSKPDRNNLNGFKSIENGQYTDGNRHSIRQRFFICYMDRPIGVIWADTERGEVVALTDNERNILFEKAAILRARSQNIIPIGNGGTVLQEYARRQANSYLAMNIGLQAIVTSPVLIPFEQPIWQFLIEVRLPTTGTLGVFGMLDVDAKSGEVIPLNNEQIRQIWGRGNAVAELCTQKTTL